MSVKVLFFGMLTEKAGVKEADVEVPAEGMKLGDLVELLKKDHLKQSTGPLILAVNEEQAHVETIVKDGDEVALMPPFAGG